MVKEESKTEENKEESKKKKENKNDQKMSDVPVDHKQFQENYDAFMDAMERKKEM